MPKFTNQEALMVVLPALRQLSSLPLSMKGALRVRKVRKAFEAHQEDIQAVKQETLKKYAELDGKGEVKTRDVTDKKGNVIGQAAVLLKGEDETETEAQETFNAEWVALMEEEFEHKWGIGLEHLPKDNKETGQNMVSADLLLRLGDLLENPEDMEKKA